MAETTDSIELPDCDYESLLELFPFLYSDEGNLSGSNVMQVLYLANKYMVPSLAGRCNEYLRDNLKASNVFSILPHAQKFKDEDLEDQCWKVIEKQTEEAVTSEEFVTLERSLVESVVKRERLNVKEAELFKAVDPWATKESERQRITPDGDAKRRIVGEEIVKAIRFPLMSLKEFASVVFDSYINSFFSSRVFPAGGPPSGRSNVWDYSRPDASADCINFTVNKPMMLHGVEHFGFEGGEYTVTTEVEDAIEGSSLVKQSASYASVKNQSDSYYSFDVRFSRPVCLVGNKEYQ
ncbi:hypothetical protein ACROYT_G038506 [Oculina patagonica]